MKLEAREIVQVAGAVLLLSSLAAPAADATVESDADQGHPTEHLFSSGRYEASVSNGALFSPFGPSRMRPTIDYSYSALQLGYMLGDVKGNGWWRGNFEVAGEGLASAIYEGPGGYIAGGTLWLRYNLVPRNGYGFVPFIQAGAGCVSTDIDHGIVGKPFNFNLEAGAGVRYLVGQNWSISLEFRFQHISNADTGEHNLGINGAGPILGVSYFF